MLTKEPALLTPPKEHPNKSIIDTIIDHICKEMAHPNSECPLSFEQIPASKNHQIIEVAKKLSLHTAQQATALKP